MPWPLETHDVNLPLIACLAVSLVADEAGLTKVDIFPREKIHNHSSCVVECPNGDLMVTWYRGSGERKADDVEILGARLRKGEMAWDPRFQLADTPGYPDCNPALFVSPAGELWLFWPTILDHNWSGALLKYRVSTDYMTPGEAPKWSKDGVLHLSPKGIAEGIEVALKKPEAALLSTRPGLVDEIKSKANDELFQRLGWMPRVHVTVLPSGRWLLPLYTDTYSVSLMAISDDQGKSWTSSTPIVGFGNIQPSVVRRNDGTLVAFMRDNGPFRRIRESTSSDDGATWTEVTSSTLPNPGAGVEAIRLASGRWAMVYNDTLKGRHSLVVSVSEDEGKTWPITRSIEKEEPESESFHYPSIMQSRDGMIHLTYTHGGRPDGSTIRHAKFSEEWLMSGAATKP